MNLHGNCCGFWPKTKEKKGVLLNISEEGETAHIDLDIYGFPKPRAVTLLKVVDSTYLTSSSRHSVTNTAREAPLASDVVETDFTNYALTVDNGEDEALTDSFYLYEDTILYWYLQIFKKKITLSCGEEYLISIPNRIKTVFY